ncbi:hypothetical protein [Flagellimonas allohymeniacidonis]|uniref:Lipoprotein n=1 Tax=Flagellimonas allohymeniacidonis TaxID=2517819 RepID=A0A4Q8QAF8_9FLAO|nr:hypothetical protein [Allomuricauda hymeniacidonis]TAI47285.1 hypothetical protein EW142_11420 [Allomuricauda hymeniacidonis]
MQKLTCLIFALALFVGCKDKKQTTVENTSDTVYFEYQKMPKKLEINPEVAAILEEWEEFKAFSNSLDVLYRATNNEDLSLAIDDLLEKEKEWGKGTYPEIFDTFQVKSRQRVLRTCMLKVKASIINKTDTTQPTIEMIEAFNIIRKQFNIIMNSQLDTKLILDAE